MSDGQAAKNPMGDVVVFLLDRMAALEKVSPDEGARKMATESLEHVKETLPQLDRLIQQIRERYINVTVAEPTG